MIGATTSSSAARWAGKFATARKSGCSKIPATAGLPLSSGTPATPSAAPASGFCGAHPTAAKASPRKRWARAMALRLPASATSPWESLMLPEERCQEIFAEILKVSDAEETELLVSGGTHQLTRFANNTIHQNVAAEGYLFSVRTVYGGRTARATTNKFDSESLRRVVAESASLARQQQPDPELLPMPGPQAYPPVERYFEQTTVVSPQDRAQAVLNAIRIAEKNGQTAAGTFSTGTGIQAVLNSRGLAAYYQETHAEFSITMLGANSTGWAKRTSPD